jgi:uracil-DNA glycosylase
MAALALATLAREIRACSRCFLAERRKQAVTWRGSATPGVVLFVGEAPGREENEAGEPFVGAAGKLLQQWIDGPLGLKPGEWLIANAVNCFPHDDFGKPVPPALVSLDACGPYLKRLVAAVQPRAIVALGRSAERALQRQGIPGAHFVYHPAYFLRSGASWDQDVARLAKSLQR